MLKTIRSCDVCGEQKEAKTKQIDVMVILDKEMDVCRSCRRLLKEAVNSRVNAIREGLVLDVV